MHRSSDYKKGAWIVHAFYGVGQIKGREEKQISGNEAEYFKIETADSTYWLPVDQIESEMLRPLSTTNDIQQALRVLQKPAKEMSSNYKVRQSHIREVQLENTPKGIACLVRDLRALQRKKGVLNHTESTAFRRLKNQFAREWGLVTQENKENIDTRLNKMLELQY